jgi:hypothetical protein
MAEADIVETSKAVETVPRRTAPPSEILVIGILQVLPSRSAPGKRSMLAGTDLLKPVYPIERIARFQIKECLSMSKIVHCLWKICMIVEEVEY